MAIFKQFISHQKRNFSGIQTVFRTQEKMTDIVGKIKAKNLRVKDLDIFKHLLTLLPKVKGPEDIEKKFRLLDRITDLNPEFDCQKFKIPSFEQNSVLLTNTKIIKENFQSAKTVIHFHSLGFVAGKATDVTNSISQIYSEYPVNKILIVGLSQIQNKSMDEIIDEAIGGYDFALNELKFNTKGLILSGSSSGCIVPIKLMEKLEERENTELRKLPKLNFMKGPTLINRPSTKKACMIMAICPNYDIRMKREKSIDLMMSSDVLSVIDEVQEKHMSGNDQIAHNVLSMTPGSTVCLSYMMNITDDRDPGFESVLKLRDIFVHPQNRHWFLYNNFSGYFHLYPFVLFLRELDFVRSHMQTFGKNKSSF